jgi:uncharacterized protein
VETKHRPHRKCIGCRVARPKEELLRFVKEPSGHAVYDMDGRRPGRGIYLCPDESCFSRAFANKKTRAAYFKKQDTILETRSEIQEEILRSIEKDLILCEKMGYLTDARDEENALGGEGLVIAASDVSPEERGGMHTAAHPAQDRAFHLPAANMSRAEGCAVKAGFPMVRRLAMNLQKYEKLSSKGPVL